MKRVATFFTHSHHAVELDWSVPLIIEFAKKAQVQIICSNIFSFEDTLSRKYPMLVGNKNISIIYLDEIYSLGRINKRFFSQRLLYKIIVKVISKFVRNTKIKMYCDRSQYIFAANYLETESKTIADLFYGYAKDSKAIFIGTPLIPWVTWYQSHFFEFDYFLASSASEFQELMELDNNSEILFLGCPSFENIASSVIENKETPSIINRSKKSALFIMINTTNPIYSKYLGIYEDIKEIVKLLESRGYECIIKLHPESLDKDKKRLKNIGITDSYFVYDSIESLALKIDLAISYLSSSILKCVAREVKSIVYLPSSFLKDFPNKPEVYQQLYFTSKELDECRLEEFCYKIETPIEITDVFEIEDDSRSQSFIENFQSENSSLRIIEYFNSVIESKEG